MQFQIRLSRKRHKRIVVRFTEEMEILKTLENALKYPELRQWTLEMNNVLKANYRILLY